jgi:hypothetical protein
MDIATFKRIAMAFADERTDIDQERGHVVLQVRGTLIEADLRLKQGDLYVVEDGQEFSAAPWIINRLASCQQLAGRLIETLPAVDQFIDPEVAFLDKLERRPGNDAVKRTSAISTLQSIFDEHEAGASLLVYLTSDAGEGKTTVINELAARQARRYRTRESDWLLVPISLGGRGLLRLDDVIIGTLVNRYRFQLWYYEAFIELVKLGVIVPALDGFEEMFVESATGEAVSALGNLVRGLDGMGNVLVAARKAYFEYLSFETQARLFDSLGNVPIATSRVALHRWTRAQFERYADLREVDDPALLYEQVVARVGDPNHPVLTRAVLVRRLVDVASDAGDRAAFVEALDVAPQYFYQKFIETIVQREIKHKWIDRSGEPYRPLLTNEAHYELLGALAQEMWTTRNDALGDDVIGLLCDLRAEAEGLSPAIAKQVNERLLQHALIVRVEGTRNSFAFDHEEFRDFFLGWGLGQRLLNGDEAEARRILDVATLPSRAVEIACHEVQTANGDVGKVLEMLSRIAGAGAVVSSLRENCGALSVCLAEFAESAIELVRLTFPPDSLKGKRLRNIRWQDCYFEPSSLEMTVFEECEFHDCEIDRLDLHDSTKCTNVKLVRCDVRAVYSPKHDAFIYDPVRVHIVLLQAGLVIEGAAEEPIERHKEAEFEELLTLSQRAIRPFLRATAVNEDVFVVKLGSKHKWVLSELERNGILQEIPYRGSGKQRRFELTVQLSDVQNALGACDGTFADFVGRATAKR